MASLSEILRRFRFHGVPGAPVIVGVPADRRQQIEAELTPVFAALADAQRTHDELIEQASAEAQRVQAAARDEARSIIEVARRDAAAARAEAAASRLTEAQSECQETLARARSESQRIVSVAEQRMPALVDEVATRVFALAAPSKQARADCEEPRK